MKKLIWLWLFVSIFFAGEALAVTHYIIAPKDTIGGVAGALDARECEDVSGNDTNDKILDESIAVVVKEGTDSAPGSLSIWKFVDDVDDDQCTAENVPWDCCESPGTGHCEASDGDTDFMIFPDDQSECPAPHADEGAWIKISSFELARSLAPQLVFRDMDEADANESAKILVNSTDDVAAQEDTDIYFCVQENGSVITDDTDCGGNWKIHIDADGNVEIKDDVNIPTGSVYKINNTQITIGNLGVGGNWTPTGTIDFGSTTDTSFKANTIDSAAINTIVDTIAWNAAGIRADGTNCTDPAEVQIGSGPSLYVIECADNDSSRIEGHVTMPDSYSGSTLVFKIILTNTNATPANNLEFQLAAMCRGHEDAINNTWSSEDVDVVDFDIDCSAAPCLQNENIVHTWAAHTPNGTCASGDTLFWYMDVGATNTTTTQMADIEILGVSVEYTSNVGD